jgi:hypothetical protein
VHWDCELKKQFSTVVGLQPSSIETNSQLVSPTTILDFDMPLRGPTKSLKALDFPGDLSGHGTTTSVAAVATELLI